MSGSYSQDYGVPDDVLYYQRLEAINTLSDRCVVLGLTHDATNNLWNPPWVTLVSGLPASGLPFGFSGSGVPVEIRDSHNNPFRAQDYMTLATAMGIGLQSFRVLSLPFFLYDSLNAVGGLRRDYQFALGGQASGASWVDAKVIYELDNFSEDVSEQHTLTAYCKLKSPYR